jgi:MYXO-CTERM domain-containing protein
MFENHTKKALPGLANRNYVRSTVHSASNAHGCEGTLPLDDYSDERPAGLTCDAIVEPSPEPVGLPEETEETPAAPLLLLLVGLAFAARRRF